MQNKKAMFRILILAFLTGILLSCGGGANVGESAPPFELVDLKGNTVNLSSIILMLLLQKTFQMICLMFLARRCILKKL